ncbi:hypothetical protein LTR95_010071 [Oleoguttula sp. CCFEE 5521]
MSSNMKQLHWTQRVALVRHNLHAASRSGDFTFFKSLQAASLIEGTNHVATLSAELGDDADILLAAMDNLNAGLAYVHQDAFQNVYDGVKSSLASLNDQSDKMEITLAKLYVDITMQRNMANMAIDKMSNSAVALINQQPERVQEPIANVWITGLTLIADCVQVSLQQMQALDTKLDDFIRLEESYSVVKTSIGSAGAGFGGFFFLKDTNSASEFPGSSANSPRSNSIASAGASMFRRMSNAFAPSAAVSSRSASVASTNSAAHTRNGSVSSLHSTGTQQQPVYRTPNYVRNSVSAGCPTALPAGFAAPKFAEHQWGKKLSTIPPTPATAEDELLDPFDTRDMPEVPKVPELVRLVSLEEVRGVGLGEVRGQESSKGMV